MSHAFRCDNERRRQVVRATSGLNGIDYVELTTAGAFARRELVVHFLHALHAPPLFSVRVEGTRLSVPVRVEGTPTVAGDVLTVRVDQRGDDGPYTLRLVPIPPAEEVPNFDPQLSEVPISFQVGCDCEVDCAPEADCVPERRDEPVLDFMARDAASLRRMLLDRLSLTTPSWRERSPADLGVALVELFAHVGDRLSYHQDAVATEAWLSTARLRTSVRRHARLVDYALHEGCNARAWVSFEALSAANIPAGAQLLAGPGVTAGPLGAVAAGVALKGGAVAFETMHALAVHPELNRVSLYTWDDQECALPRGATRATLGWEAAPTASAGLLQAGRVILFEERVDPRTGRDEDADPTRRHAVRLTRVGPVRADPAHPTSKFVREVEWHADDALPFDLTVSARYGAAHTLIENVTVALCNVALADHGASQALSFATPAAPVDPPPDGERPPTLRVPLDAPPLTRVDRLEGASATSSMRRDPRAALPVASFNGGEWSARVDLLASDGTQGHFVVEAEATRSYLRFGDDVHGRRPEPATTFVGEVRLGNGRAGNVATDALTAFSLPAGLAGAVVATRNPLPARGGVDPEPLDVARALAPDAFKRQERAVTLDDWVEAALRHPEVSQAAATQRWTGAWHTVFLTIDPKGGVELDDALRARLLAHLDPFRMAGCDIEVDAPRYVPIELSLRVCVDRGRLRGEVRRALLELFSSRDLPSGGRGLFHPDRFTFGQPVYLSPLLLEASRVPGVLSVRPLVFRRLVRGAPAAPEPARAWPTPDALVFSRLEIPRLDNFSAHPLRGRVTLHLEGGL